MTFHRIIPRSREEWLGLRRGRMTSSLVAGALGMNEHMTPLEAWCAITGRDDFDGNKATLRGTLLEGPVLDYPTREGAYTRLPAAFVHNDWTGDSADCLYTSPAGDLYVGEGKTAALTMADGWGTEGTDEIPLNVVVQCCWHMGHWPETVATVVPMLIGGYKFEFREYRVKREDDLIGSIFESAERFYRDYVVNDRPPPASAGDDDALRHLWPKHVPEKFLPPSDELEQLTRAYVEARDTEKAAEKLKKAHGARLRQLLGDAEGAQGRGWKITHKYQAGPMQTDWEGLAKHLGATFADEQKFTSQQPGWRVLRATLPAGKKPAQKKGKVAA